MRVVALVSGGKDSCFNMMHCVANGHSIVALANLHPPPPPSPSISTTTTSTTTPATESTGDEMDSYMYQTVAHDAVGLLADCMGVRMFRRQILGRSVSTGSDYTPVDGDEVEDLLRLLGDVKAAIPDVDAVSVGAILSNYQRVRVEGVCARLGLTCLAYLWRQEQADLMSRMIETGLHAVIVKVAALGLAPKHLGRSLSAMHGTLLDINSKYGCHICGEGGEYETLTLDCPLFQKRLVIDKTETVIHSDDGFMKVAYLRIVGCHVEDKPGEEIGLSDDCRAALLSASPVARIHEFIPRPADQGLNAPDALPLTLRNSVAVAHQPPPSNTARFGPFLALSGVRSANGEDSVAEQGKSVMEQIQSTLESKNCTWSDVTLMQVYVANMADFASMNSIYATFFGINPPPRVTVELPLDPGILIQVDCLAFQHDRAQRETMHVQGISYWAPANIGPYSQTVKVLDHLYVAGQIGLVPNTMSLPAPAPAASTDHHQHETHDNDNARAARSRQFHSECGMSLHSLAAVAAAQGCAVGEGDAVGAVCFVADGRFCAAARAAWGAVCGDAPLLVAVVPGLPKGALVEWQAVVRDKTRAAVDDVDDDDDAADNGQSGGDVVVGVDSPTRGYGADKGSMRAVIATVSLDAFSTPSNAAAALVAAVQAIDAKLDARQRASGKKSLFLWRVFYVAGAVGWEDAQRAIDSAFQTASNRPSVAYVPVTALEGGAVYAVVAHGVGNVS
ncbi:hypothetical protein DFJ73DRAFT_664006 [Zopfochytrium polystomum]|nr:hypothetical protein DFJ73DRAFT_664006 [Zopfochytrium polystomum]